MNFELENDRRAVETSLIFTRNVYREAVWKYSFHIIYYSTDIFSSLNIQQGKRSISNHGQSVTINKSVKEYLNLFTTNAHFTTFQHFLEILKSCNRICIVFFKLS